MQAATTTKASLGIPRVCRSLGRHTNWPYALFYGIPRPVKLATLALALLAPVLAHASVGVNAVLDLSIPAPQQPQTDSKVFDESVVFAPNFAINQNDPALSDLFSANGVSNLCFPTALAQNLIYLQAYGKTQLSGLRLAGQSADSKSINPNELVRQLSTLCHTNPANGTDSLDALNCTLSMLSQSGLATGNTQLISPFNHDTTLPIISRAVTIKDIRDALKTGTPVLLEAAWFSFDPRTQTWSRQGGHYVGVYGYDYDKWWGENLIQLKVINPETRYDSSRQNALFDTITVERVSEQPGITYPANRPFILSGSGFGGLTKRAFLGMMMTVSPSTPSSPQ